MQNSPAKWFLQDFAQSSRNIGEISCEMVKNEETSGGGAVGEGEETRGRGGEGRREEEGGGRGIKGKAGCGGVRGKEKGWGRVGRSGDMGRW